MVFETIYSLYEKEVVNEIKKLKTDEEIKFIERKGIIRDIVLKRLAKALSVAVYRNGKIEDDFKIANAVLRFSEMCASDWNEPELDDSIYNKELLDLL